MPNVPPYTHIEREIGDPGLTQDQLDISLQLEKITDWINSISASLPLPQIYRITPDTGPAGTVVRLEGNYLQGVIRVGIGGVDELPFRILSSKLLEFTITSDVISDKVRLISEAGQVFGPFFTVPNEAPIVGAVSVNPNPVFNNRQVIFKVDATDGDGVQEVQFMVRGTAEDVLVASTSTPLLGNTYQVSWTPTVAGNLTVRAKVIDNRGAFSYSPYSPLIVQPNVLPAGVPPSINLNTTTRQISASPSVPGDILEQNINSEGWEPYDGAFSVGTVYRAAGYYKFRSRANTEHSASAPTSSPEILAVGAPAPNGPQNVVLLAPEGNLTAGTSYTLTATATASRGLSKAEFYEGLSLLGSDSIAPYSISYTPATTGVKVLRVVFTDNGGSTAEATIGRNVVAPGETGGGGEQPVNQAPQVVLTSPSAQSIVAGTSLGWAINATDADGSIVSRELLVNGTSVATGTSGDYTFATPGSYNLAARATDNSNASTTSSSVTITVTPAQGGNTTPAAPTGALVDDTANTFDWTNTPSFTSLADYEQTLDAGATFTALSAKPLVVGNIAKAAGQVGVRVKAVTGRNASAWLFNSTPFTVAQPAFTPTLTGPSATENSGVTLTTDGGADQIEYTIIPNPANTLPATMSLTLGGEIVVVIDFPASYLGAALRFKRAGSSTIQSFTFIDGPQAI